MHSQGCFSATPREAERDALAEESVGHLQKHSEHMGSVASLCAKSSSQAFRGGLVRHEVAVSPSRRPPGSCLHKPAPAACILSIKQASQLPFRPCPATGGLQLLPKDAFGNAPSVMQAVSQTST